MGEAAQDRAAPVPVAQLVAALQITDRLPEHSSLSRGRARSTNYFCLGHSHLAIQVCTTLDSNYFF